MAVYDEFIEVLQIAWKFTNERYRKHPDKIELSKDMLQFVAPVGLKKTGDPFLELWEAVAKTWVRRWKAGYLKFDTHGNLIAENARLNAATIGLQHLYGLLRDSAAKLAKKTVFQRAVHAALESHHIIEYAWVFTPPYPCPKLREYFLKRGGRNGMPAVNLTSIQHRGNADAIAGLAAEQLQEFGLETAKESVTTVLNRTITKVVSDEDYLQQLHKVYRDYFPTLYKAGIEKKLNEIAAEIATSMLL